MALFKEDWQAELENCNKVIETAQKMIDINEPLVCFFETMINQTDSKEAK